MIGKVTVAGSGGPPFGYHWLFLDTTYLGARASHTPGLGNLSYQGNATGVVFGVLRDVVNLTNDHLCPRVAFTFDRKPYKRLEVYPGYKDERSLQHLTQGMKQRRRERLDQLELLRDDVLPGLGFANVFHAEGYEADDVLASLCQHLPTGEKAVVVSEDEDLYQLLSPSVTLWKPRAKRFYGDDDFRRQWGVEPSRWASIKAMAGCASDCIGGIAGVGVKTAAAYLRGELNPKSACHTRLKHYEPSWRKNLRLVELPYPGTPLFTLREDALSAEVWRDTCRRFGMTSLENRLPYGVPACTT